MSLPRLRSCPIGKIALLLAGALLVSPMNIAAQDAPTPASPETTMPSVPVVEPAWEKLAEGLEFPEGPAWNGADTLYFSSCQGRYVGLIGPSGQGVLLAKDSAPDIWQRTNGLAVGADGNVYACEWGEKGGRILRVTPAGDTTILTREFEGAPYARPNDLAFDREGNLYFTDPRKYDAKNPDGFVYRLDARSGVVSRATQQAFSFCNGLAFSPDGKALFLAESARNRVLRLAVNPDGTLGPAEPFVEMPGGDPDGMNFDSAGNLYIAHFGGGVVWVVAPDGAVLRKLKAPGKKPSNVDFGGADLKTLYLTEDETNGIYRIPVEVAGEPLFWNPARQ